jgi:PA domain
MKLRGFGLPAVVVGISVTLSAQGQAPTPGVVAGNFRTYAVDALQTSTDAAQWIDQYFALNASLQPALNGEFFHVGVSPFAYEWRRTGTSKKVGGMGKKVDVDYGVWALVQALGTAGSAQAFSTGATNPTDMGTGGILAAQALALKINQGFSEEFVTPATGFSGLSLVDMAGVKLSGRPLTPAQANALNGEATLQIREATDVPLGRGPLPYGLSFGQLTNLLDLLNGSFDAGHASPFAQAHLYQPYVTSDAFLDGERRPSTVSVFAFKPAYNTFQGDVFSVGTGCALSDFANLPSGGIALIERGVCSFYAKVSMASNANASAAIIFNSRPELGGECPTVPTPGSSRCEALVGMGATPPFTPLPIPAAFVQRSTGLLLKNAAPVFASVQQ